MFSDLFLDNASRTCLVKLAPSFFFRYNICYLCITVLSIYSSLFLILPYFVIQQYD